METIIMGYIMLYRVQGVGFLRFRVSVGYCPPSVTRYNTVIYSPFIGPLV